MSHIGVIGVGAVGSAVLEGMGRYHETSHYDIDGRGDWYRVLDSEAAFVCVPTDGDGRGRLNLLAVETVCAELRAAEYAGLVVVKSTLPVGASLRLLTGPAASLRLVYMPEFLRESSALEWFLSPDRIVAAGPAPDVAAALSLFEWVDDSVPRLVMSFEEAELGKLAHNAYIATKVTFTCEIERICGDLDVEARPVMEVVWSDRRVGSSAHLVPGLGGFSGRCVPKDTRELRANDGAPDSASLLQFVLDHGQQALDVPMEELPHG